MKLVIVSARYGPEVTGGAEALLRDYAERLHDRGHSVTVLTTCATDHYTWANAAPAGITTVNGIPVERFPITEQSDTVTRQRLEFALQGGFSLGRDDAAVWARTGGFSEPLIAALPARAADADAVLFAPYILATTLFGVPQVAEKAIVIPCLHDEIYATLPLVHDVIGAARGVIFNAEGERRVAERLIGDMPPARVVGGGFDDTRARDSATAHRSAVAYAGRREGAKNFHLLLAWLAIHNAQRTTPVGLDVMGTGPEPIRGPAVPWTTDHGFVDAGVKDSILGTALVTANLSVKESFSYVIMESWLAGTPVIVHADCAVTVQHCEESGGGIWVRDAAEFSAALDRLEGDPDLRARMASAGQRYVLSRYSWPAVLDRLERALAELA